jgi:hypothetical protein
MHARGELMMLPPTVYNLKFLAEHATAADAIAAGGARTDVPCILPKMRTDDAGKFIGIALPGDPDYDSL